MASLKSGVGDISLTEEGMGRLSDRVAIVTGGGRGIGKATALLLAQEGAHVAVLARSEQQVRAVADRIKAQGFPRALPLTVDVSRWEEAQPAVSRVLEVFGRVDILINNAGVIHPVAPAHRVDPQAWGYNIDVNLKGAFFMARAVLPTMLAQKAGVIVNVGSGAAHRVITSWSAYCAAKAGLYHLTRVLAAELEGTGVRVHSVRPGVVDTEMQRQIREVPEEDFGPENLAHFRRLKSEGLLLPPEYPARLIVWLCTDEAADFHGQEADIYEPEWRRRAQILDT